MKRSLSIFLVVFSILPWNNNKIMGESPSLFFKDESKVAVVVIDAGHGGKDPGAVVAAAREKDIVLDIALRLGAAIKENYPSVKVIYTRQKDVFVPLYKRAEIANRNGADLFISIHANYVPAKSVQGTETFVLGQHRSEENLEVAKKENSVILLEDDYSTTYENFDPNSSESYIMFEMLQDEYLGQSIMFAQDVQEQFRTVSKRHDRSVKQAGFLVLRKTTMPSVLIEAGFLSNQSERNYLLGEAGRASIASSVFNAFEGYKKRIEGKSSFNMFAGGNIEMVTGGDIDREIIEQGKEQEVNVPVSDTYYSVQVAASRRSLDTKPANFKGEKNIFKIDTGGLYKYYSGKFGSYDEAVGEKYRLQRKYKGAFIVTINNNNPVPVIK